MDDVRAVMDATGSERAALFGISEGGPMSILFAATYPERTSALILYGSIAKGSWTSDYPWGARLDDGGREEWLEGWRKEWGGPYGIDSWAPSAADDAQFRQWWAKYLRLGASPSAVINVFRMNAVIDVRDILPAVRVPTLVLHRSGDRAVNVEQGQYLAQHIPAQGLSSKLETIICGGLGIPNQLSTRFRSSLLESAIPQNPTVFGNCTFHGHRRFNPTCDRDGRSPLEKPYRKS